MLKCLPEWCFWHYCNTKVSIINKIKIILMRAIISAPWVDDWGISGWWKVKKQKQKKKQQILLFVHKYLCAKLCQSVTGQNEAGEQLGGMLPLVGKTVLLGAQCADGTAFLILAVTVFWGMCQSGANMGGAMPLLPPCPLLSLRHHVLSEQGGNTPCILLIAETAILPSSNIGLGKLGTETKRWDFQQHLSNLGI